MNRPETAGLGERRAVCGRLASVGGVDRPETVVAIDVVPDESELGFVTLFR
jgi:hypothetical protein